MAYEIQLSHFDPVLTRFARPPEKLQVSRRSECLGKGHSIYK
jgi:hypothetical protein